MYDVKSEDKTLASNTRNGMQHKENMQEKSIHPKPIS